MIPHQHPSFVEGWAQEHRRRLISEAEIYRRVRSAQRKRNTFDATCITLGTWLVAWGTWLVERYTVDSPKPLSTSACAPVAYKAPYSL